MNSNGILHNSNEYYELRFYSFSVMWLRHVKKFVNSLKHTHTLLLVRVEYTKSCAKEASYGPNMPDPNGEDPAIIRQVM